MNLRNALVLVGLAAVLLYAVGHLPSRGDPDAPAHWRTSPAGTPGAGTYYLEHALEDAATPNVVTAVLADYRGLDTLGETFVVFTGGIACLLILRRRS